MTAHGRNSRYRLVLAAVERKDEWLRVYPKTPSPASEHLEKPGIGNFLGWVFGRRTPHLSGPARRV